MKLKALGDTLIIDITEDKKEFTNDAGIILLVNPKKFMDVGPVIAVGKDVKDVKVGDIVYFKKILGPDFKLENRHYLAMKEKDLLSVVQENV